MSEKHFWLLKNYEFVRKQSMIIAEPLEIEEMVVQPADEVSPIKWHLGHSSWFYDKFILNSIGIHLENQNDYDLIFNSYYKSIGAHWEQNKRGVLSRPTVDQVIKYRNDVDNHILNMSLENLKKNEILLTAGLHHEMQHQELMLMDIKYIKHNESIKVPYVKKNIPQQNAVDEEWYHINEGIYLIGNESKQFHYDNETAQHKVYLKECSISKNYVTNGEFLEFVTDGGYKKPNLWLSQGWDWILKNNVLTPLYWYKKENEWFEHTLHGEIKLDLMAPVCHISYFEADAFARWKNVRLPTEFEYEIFDQNISSNQSRFMRDDTLHPKNKKGYFNELWCWTGSQYTAYPGFKPFAGKISEYNGKFMCNQFILRGGCFATPKGHYRHTYRNFYLPHQRWMFSGLRLAMDL